MIVYAETGLGACLTEARDVESGRRAILKEVGTYNGVKVCRKATKDDIEWVRAMGGYVPEKTKRRKAC